MRVSQNHAAYLCQVSRRTVQRWVRQGQVTLGRDQRLDTDELVDLGLLRPERATLPLPRRADQGLLREVLLTQQATLTLLTQLLDEIRNLRQLVRQLFRQQHPC